VRRPILAASHLVAQFHTIVSRRLAPGERAVVSVCRFEAGTGYNIIPDTAFLQGTVRTLSEATGELVREVMQGMADGLAAGMGVQAEFAYERGFPVVVNDPASTARAVRILKGISEEVEGDIDPVMAGEDFSHYLRRVPGCFLFMGCGPCAAKGGGVKGGGGGGGDRGGGGGGGGGGGPPAAAACTTRASASTRAACPGAWRPWRDWRWTGDNPLGLRTSHSTCKRQSALSRI
jgi:hypothetical protein